MSWIRDVGCGSWVLGCSILFLVAFAALLYCDTVDQSARFSWLDSIVVAVNASQCRST